jgi:hypothetical protein
VKKKVSAFLLNLKNKISMFLLKLEHDQYGCPPAECKPLGPGAIKCECGNTFWLIGHRVHNVGRG